MSFKSLGSELHIVGQA